jgi:hypothetical protein
VRIPAGRQTGARDVPHSSLGNLNTVSFFEYCRIAGKSSFPEIFIGFLVHLKLETMA